MIIYQLFIFSIKTMSLAFRSRLYCCLESAFSGVRMLKNGLHWKIAISKRCHQDCTISSHLIQIIFSTFLWSSSCRTSNSNISMNVWKLIYPSNPNFCTKKTTWQFDNCSSCSSWPAWIGCVLQSELWPWQLAVAGVIYGARGVAAFHLGKKIAL